MSDPESPGEPEQGGGTRDPITLAAWVGALVAPATLVWNSTIFVAGPEAGPFEYGARVALVSVPFVSALTLLVIFASKLFQAASHYKPLERLGSWLESLLIPIWIAVALATAILIGWHWIEEQTFRFKAVILCSRYVLAAACLAILAEPFIGLVAAVRRRVAMFTQPQHRHFVASPVARSLLLWGVVAAMYFGAMYAILKSRVEFGNWVQTLFTRVEYSVEQDGPKLKVTMQPRGFASPVSCLILTSSDRLKELPTPDDFEEAELRVNSDGTLVSARNNDPQAEARLSKCLSIRNRKHSQLEGNFSREIVIPMDLFDPRPALYCAFLSHQVPHPNREVGDGTFRINALEMSPCGRSYITTMSRATAEKAADK